MWLCWVKPHVLASLLHMHTCPFPMYSRHPIFDGAAGLGAYYSPHVAPSAQIQEQQLLKTKLRRSPLSVAFHVKDMLGLGLLQRVTTPAGTFVRVVKSK